MTTYQRLDHTQKLDELSNMKTLLLISCVVSSFVFLGALADHATGKQIISLRGKRSVQYDDLTNQINGFPNNNDNLNSLALESPAAFHRRVSDLKLRVREEFLNRQLVQTTNQLDASVVEKKLQKKGARAQLATPENLSDRKRRLHEEFMELNTGYYMERTAAETPAEKKLRQRKEYLAAHRVFPKVASDKQKKEHYRMRSKYTI